MTRRVSLVTPSHDVRFLKRAAWSVAQQTDLDDVEWVIVVNGTATSEDVLRETADLGSRVSFRIVRAPEHEKTIGALKLCGFMVATGDVLIELDHDDALAPECIAEVRAAFETGAEFAYSNMALMDEGWRSFGLWPEYVTTRKCRVYGREMEEGIASFSPHTILNAGAAAPCHVRAWTRELYQRLGGHDRAVNFTEDLEFLSRVYASGCKVAHIDKPLYLYYVAPNDQRRQAAWAVRAEHLDWIPRHIESVVREWCRRNDLAVLHGFDELAHRNSGQPAGLVILGDEAAPEDQKRVIYDAWDALAHGGFLIARVSQTWTPQPFIDVFRPNGAEPFDRFQEFQAQFYDVETHAGVNAVGIADKDGPALPGVNHWRPRVNASYFSKIESIANWYGVSVEFRDGRGYVRGARSSEAVRLWNMMRPGCFVEMQEAVA